MIPYPELAAALEQWRLRTGLPTHAAIAAPRPALASAPVAVAAAPPPRPPAPPPGRSTVYGVPPPPAAVAPVAPRPPTNLPDDEVNDLDADVLDEAQAEDVYDNEGNDFAVSFSGPPAAASGSIGGHDDDLTNLGAEAALADPFDSQTAAVGADLWPELAEPPEATNAAGFGWGSSHRPEGDLPDDEGRPTVVGITKPR